MYYRSQGYRYPRDMRIPINYSGNAFSESNQDKEKEPDADSEDIIAPQAPPTAEPSQDESASINFEEKPLPSKEPKTTPASLLGGAFGKIGTEELLILALVFLLSDNDSESDIIWLLLLLLFIK